MLSSLAMSLAQSSVSCTSAPMLGAVGAVTSRLRPWLASYSFARRSFAAQAMPQTASDADSDAEQLPAYSRPVQPAAAAPFMEKPAPIPVASGRIHSVDTFSAVDGPGLRMVVFEQVRLQAAPCPGHAVASCSRPIRCVGKVCDANSSSPRGVPALTTHSSPD